MKKITSVLLLLAMAVAALISTVSCSRGDDSIPEGMKKLENDADLDYVMFIPEDWTQDLSGGAVSAYYAKGDMSNVSMTSFALTELDTTLDTHVEEYVEKLKKTFSDLELNKDDPSDVTLGGIKAKRIRYTGKLSDSDYSFLQLITIRNANMYIFTYTSEKEAFDKHMEEVQQIINNFSFK